MKILFVGAVEFSQRCLRALRAAGHDPDVLTLWESEGRQRHTDWVDLSAQPRGVLYEGSLPNIKGQYDLALVCGWSRLLPTDLAPHMVGSHPTLLPKGRGRHPIPWSILMGDGEWAGLTFFRLVAEPDAGPILWQAPIGVGPLDHAGDLYEKVCERGEQGVVEVVRRIQRGDTETIQDEARASWWPKRSEEDNRVDWTRAEGVARLVRAMSRPYGGAWSMLVMGSVRLPIRWWRVANWNDNGLIAPPGTIQRVSEEHLVVATGDGWVAFSEWSVPAGQTVRPGMRLG